MNERARAEAIGQSLENSAFFMPFSANRQFKKAPRLLARAEGIHYYTPEGRKVIDGTSGLWCVNAGHCRKKIVEAVQRQVATMEFAPPFQMGHPAAFEFADRLAALWAPIADPRMYCLRLLRHVREWKEGRPEDAARGLAGMYGPP